MTVKTRPHQRRVVGGGGVQIAILCGRAEVLHRVKERGAVATTERMFVIRVRNGKAEWVDVRRGAADKDLVEVTGDLEPGDEVVTRGSDEIRAGTPMVPKRQTVKPS